MLEALLSSGEETAGDRVRGDEGGEECLRLNVYILPENAEGRLDVDVLENIVDYVALRYV